MPDRLVGRRVLSWPRTVVGLELVRSCREAGLHGDVAAEFTQFRSIDIDGVFTDFADVAVETYGAGR
jgi:hypothetical protein